MNGEGSRSNFFVQVILVSLYQLSKLRVTLNSPWQNTPLYPIAQSQKKVGLYVSVYSTMHDAPFLQVFDWQTELWPGVTRMTDFYGKTQSPSYMKLKYNKVNILTCISPSNKTHVQKLPNAQTKFEFTRDPQENSASRLQSLWPFPAAQENNVWTFKIHIWGTYRFGSGCWFATRACDVIARFMRTRAYLFIVLISSTLNSFRHQLLLI